MKLKDKPSTGDEELPPPEDQTPPDGDGANETDAAAPAIPQRMNADVLPNVETAASTITGCSDSEVKNYMATADYICRQTGVQFADLWKEICQVAKKNGRDGEKAAKVSISIKVEIDHTNILLHSTKVQTGFGEKHGRSDEIQEDLSQTEFNLKA